MRARSTPTRRPDPVAFDAMVAADARITEPMIRAFIGPVGWDPATEVSAAAAFRNPR